MPCEDSGNPETFNDTYTTDRKEMVDLELQSLKLPHSCIVDSQIGLRHVVNSSSYLPHLMR